VLVSCLVCKRWKGASREYLNGVSWSIIIPIDERRYETVTYQNQDKNGELADAMDFDG
jgi:hypothetical protein